MILDKSNDRPSSHIDYHTQDSIDSSDSESVEAYGSESSQGVRLPRSLATSSTAPQASPSNSIIASSSDSEQVSQSSERDDSRSSKEQLVLYRQQDTSESPSEVASIGVPLSEPDFGNRRRRQVPRHTPRTMPRNARGRGSSLGQRNSASANQNNNEGYEERYPTSDILTQWRLKTVQVGRRGDFVFGVRGVGDMPRGSYRLGSITSKDDSTTTIGRASNT